MIYIDGSNKEGGGQIFRSALTLSLLSGKSITIKNIRAGRKKPGLLRQHLACLKAAAEISSANVKGAELGSSYVEFEPRQITAGDYDFAVGSAGSTTLIFQTIFLALALKTKEISTVTLVGGTHNPLAPSYDFISKSFLPLVKKLGLNVDTNLERYGFAPMGNGKWSAKIYPVNSGQPFLSMIDYSKPVVSKVVATSANIEKTVVTRELEQVNKRLKLDPFRLIENRVDSAGPGNILSIQAVQNDHTHIFETHGARNTSSKKVANIAVDCLFDLNTQKATVCEYMADQILLPLILTTGGEFIAQTQSLHFETQIDTINQFYPELISIEKTTNKVLVKCAKLKQN